MRGPGRAAIQNSLREQVAGMRIGVEESIDQKLLKVGLEEFAGHILTRDSCRCEPVEVSDFDVFDVLERKHAPGAYAFEHPRHQHPWIAGEIAGEGFGAVGFALIVQFGQHAFREFPRERIEIGPLPDRWVTFQPARDGFQRAQVDGDDLVETGPLHLDHNPFARFPDQGAVGLAK